MKRVIWIDEKVKSMENQMFLEILKGGIKNAKFYPVESIEEAFQLIRNKKEEITLLNGNKKETKVFQYRLFYTIISGSLSNEFFNEYIKATKELTIISANIIFCNNEEKHRYNAYYLDKFLNPGKVYNEKSFDKIIEYINKDENPFLNNNLMVSKNIYEPLKRNYGNIFFNASNISDIAYPFFLGQILNSTLINEYDLEGFQRFLLDYYPELKDLIIPSREKKIDIPYYLLARFYLHMYTYETCLFFKNMNLDLTNDKFDIYRIYIFLLYDALNKKSIKSFSKKSLYRGTVLSKKELEDLETLLQYNKDIKKYNGNKSAINVCLYNCKMFLSFSKSLEVAKRFINKGNENLIPVLFEVEGLDEKDKEENDFFISNLDLENISEYNDEQEVLFLPFSCFVIISIKDEEINSFGEKIKIKKITLNYLSKYKTSLYKYIEKIKEKEKFEKFLKEVINSSFSYEIAELLNFKDFEIGKEFQNFLKQKFILKKEYLDFKPIQCFQYKSSLYAQTAINNIFEEIPESIQKVLVNGAEALLVVFENGTKLLMQQVENKIICNCNCCNYECCIPPVEIKLSNISKVNIHHKLNKANNEYIEGKNDNWLDKGIEKVNHKEKKLGLQKSAFFEFYSLGIAIGDLIANYDNIKDQPLMTKLKILGNNSIKMLTPFLPRITATFLPEAIFTKIPYVMAAVSAVEFILSTKDIILDKSINKSETACLIFKKAAIMTLQIGATFLVGQLGFKLFMFMPTVPGAVVVIGAIGLGIGVGLAMRKIHNYFISKNETRNELTFFSESLYYQYIPTKFREYCIPTLLWKGTSENAKSFAIELVEDGYRKWLIINIKKWIRKISNDNYLDVGETILDYKGISKNPYKVTFILYELKEDNFKPEDWGEGKKDKKDYSEKLSNSFIQVATLDVF